MSEGVTLSPETHPTTHGLCSEKIQQHGGPAIGNLFCSGGRINTAAWSAYVELHDGLMRLPTHASLPQIEVAGCKFRGNHTGSQLPQIYQLVAAYNGWSVRQAVIDYLYAHCA